MQPQYAMSNQKMKLITLIDLLKKFSDENHPLSAPEIIKLLSSRGTKCERKYVYNALDTLVEYGMDINRTYHPKQGFYLGERDFELAEIKILIDAVSSAPFITPKKSKELVEKLENQLSVYQSAAAARGVHFGNTSKLDNEEIYYTIDTINHALCTNKKIKFIYHHTVIKNNHIAMNDGKEFIVSPYALIWSNDRYYLVCNYSKYNNISHYRVDRMKKVSLIGENARSCAEVSIYKNNNEFDIIDYVKKTFGMFSGSEENVELICDNSLLEIIIDKFGSDVKIMNYSTKQFKAHVSLFIGKVLVSWLVDHADKIYVENPVSLRNMVKDKINTIYSIYFPQNNNM